MNKSAGFWVTVGLGVAGLTAVTVLVAQYYARQQRANEDPRARQVQELLDEASDLLAQSRRTFARRERA
ncbi:MAG: hypothetical protein ACYCW6_32110 [Candidatus Xenobia bacterium]